MPILRVLQLDLFVDIGIDSVELKLKSETLEVLGLVGYSKSIVPVFDRLDCPLLHNISKGTRTFS